MAWSGNYQLSWTMTWVCNIQFVGSGQVIRLLDFGGLGTVALIGE